MTTYHVIAAAGDAAEDLRSLGSFETASARMALEACLAHLERDPVANVDPELVGLDGVAELFRVEQHHLREALAEPDVSYIVVPTEAEAHFVRDFDGNVEEASEVERKRAQLRRDLGIDVWSDRPGSRPTNGSGRLQEHVAVREALALRSGPDRGAGLRRAEAVALDLEDVDHGARPHRVRRGKGRKPRQASLADSAGPALEDWLQVRGMEPGPLFCSVRKTGALVRDPDGALHRLTARRSGPRPSCRGARQASSPPRPTPSAGPGPATSSTPASISPPRRRWPGTRLRTVVRTGPPTLRTAGPRWAFAALHPTALATLPVPQCAPTSPKPASAMASLSFFWALGPKPCSDASSAGVAFATSSSMR